MFARSLSDSPSRPPDHIYLSWSEALELAAHPNWDATIQTICQLTGQPEAVVAAAVAMPTATCEHWLLTQLAARHQLTPVQWALSHDRFMGFNPEKRLMIRHKVIYGNHGLNGSLIREQSLTTRQATLNGLPMDQIDVRREDGEYINLVDFHRQWWLDSGLGGVEIKASEIAHQLLGADCNKQLWYPVFFLLMSANLIFLENYSPRFCKELWPVVAEVWERTCQSGHRPRLVKLPLTAEIDWFLERPGLEPPPQVRCLLDQFA